MFDQLQTPSSASFSKRLATTEALFGAPASWLEINQTAFDYNVSTYKRIVGNSVALAIVVKGNAYGHGIAEISTLCQQNSFVDWLCTTNLSEALLIRSKGITKPILILSMLDGDPRLAIEHDIDVIAYDLATIIALNTIAAQVGKPIHLHLKIDTGLSRYGIYTHEAVSVIQNILQLSHVKLRGIFTHFAESDNQNTEYTLKQLHAYQELLSALAALNITIPYKHAGNSAATMALPGSHFNFVRIGAGAYGLRPSAYVLEQAQMLHQDFHSKPVMTWKTKIQQLRTVPAGNYVGYARTHQTSTATVIATIPVGYYEGYDRRLGNKGTVIVRAQAPDGVKEIEARVIGRICMNVTMIDVTHIEGVNIGDEIILLGNHPAIKAHEIANLIEGYNPREITTRINPLVPRIVTSN